MNEIGSVTIGIPVVDLTEGIAWYRRLLPNAEEIAPAPGVWEISITPSVWLQVFEQKCSGPNPAVIRFECVCIEAGRELALELSKEVGEIETIPGVVRYFEFRDPFGNQFSYYELMD